MITKYVGKFKFYSTKATTTRATKKEKRNFRGELLRLELFLILFINFALPFSFILLAFIKRRE